MSAPPRSPRISGTTMSVMHPAVGDAEAAESAELARSKETTNVTSAPPRNRVILVRRSPAKRSSTEQTVRTMATGSAEPKESASFWAHCSASVALKWRRYGSSGATGQLASRVNVIVLER
eukprot:7349163-Prymnesium_polylepis.1